ncbi:Phage-associated recombinase [Lactococcus lactis subsp. lactis]|uniref:Phage-associated recombinase n=1 Tax=Lactococcus lactis subsp. lactis TaxID=1360 RepID=A0A0V8E602_LACLL|nr:ERF family protein [Lactococcus lactis]KSU21235.1 Phage-associated recombinase [Lactococcus lactis subsp. lactis]
MEKSESVKELFVALTKFRKSLKQPLKDAQNPFFKKNYVPLENVVETIDKAIVDTGLSYLQEISENRVNTIITHESGQYLIIGGSEVKPVKPDPQALGSAITYAKRYSLCCAFGITSDEDDDGNAASGGKPQQQAQNNQQRGNYQNQQRNNYQQQGQYPPRNY